MRSHRLLWLLGRNTLTATATPPFLLGGQQQPRRCSGKSSGRPVLGPTTEAELSATVEREFSEFMVTHHVASLLGPSPALTVTQWAALQYAVLYDGEPNRRRPHRLGHRPSRPVKCEIVAADEHRRRPSFQRVGSNTELASPPPAPPPLGLIRDNSSKAAPRGT